MCSSENDFPTNLTLGFSSYFSSPAKTDNQPVAAPAEFKKRKRAMSFRNSLRASGAASAPPRPQVPAGCDNPQPQPLAGLGLLENERQKRNRIYRQATKHRKLLQLRPADIY